MRLLRLARLDQRRLAIEAARDAYRRAEGRQHFPDTVQAGLFRIAATRDLFGQVTPLAERLSRELQPALDSAARAAVGDWTVYVRRPTPFERRLTPFATLTIAVRHQGNPGIRNPGDSPIGLERHLQQQLTFLVTSAISAGFDRQLHGWLFNAPVTPLPPDGAIEDAARLELATADSHAARRCVAGDLPMCAVLLALRGRPDDPLRGWYGREDYRALVTRLRLAPSDGADAPRLQRACMRDGGDACPRLLTRLPADRIPAPTMDGPRRILLHEALQLGGAGALTRLRALDGDVGVRLARAAGVPEDSLLASWRRRMLAPRGANVRPAPVVALASLGWVMLLGALSLRRTRRCR